MNEKQSTHAPQERKQPGFLQRMLEKLDRQMKDKAEEKARSGSCCSPDRSDGKGGKCC